MMEKFFRLVVFMMCIAWLLSLFGCGKGHLVDGPGMERGVWSEFTISQSSDVYEQNFSYTVRFDEKLFEAYLYIEVYDYKAGYPIEKKIKLKEKTISALFSLDMMSFPDEIPYEGEEEILDGTFLSFSVTDQNGNVSKKSIPREAAKEILTLITPYANQLKGE